MSSRCDRLGELLSAALTEGTIPEYPHESAVDASGRVAESVESGADVWKTSAHGDEPEEGWMSRIDFEDYRQERRHASGQRQQTRSSPGGAEKPAGGAGSSSVIRRERLPPVLTPDALAAYSALGLAAGSPMSAVKKAYRTLLKKYHPDNTAPFENMQRTAAQKTDRIVQAFKVLEDWFARCRP